MTHPDEDSLELYVLGDRLAPEQADKIVDHLLLCEPCRTRCDYIEEFVRSIRAANPQKPAK
jgi:hypothetical protein